MRPMIRRTLVGKRVRREVMSRGCNMNIILVINKEMGFAQPTLAVYGNGNVFQHFIPELFHVSELYPVTFMSSIINVYRFLMILSCIHPCNLPNTINLRQQ